MEKIEAILKAVFVLGESGEGRHSIEFIEVVIGFLTTKEGKNFQICLGVFGAIFLAFYCYYTAIAMRQDRPGPNNSFILFSTGILVIFNLFLIIGQFIYMPSRIWAIWLVMIFAPIISLTVCYIIYYPGAKNGMKMKKKLTTERVLCMPIPCRCCARNIHEVVESKLRGENRCCTSEKNTRILVKVLVIVCFFVLVVVDGLLYYAITDDSTFNVVNKESERAFVCISVIYGINGFFMGMYVLAALVELVTLFIVPCVKPKINANEIKNVLFARNAKASYNKIEADAHLNEDMVTDDAV